ncbi:biotin-dependent carboxyltransferase family protein [Bacillus sp. SG-1]|uniref:5-oxoprolinase subunit C family protein n=1 Tax=Bacillus sp. SG-1 TaxID=161544 RepID=UPI0001543776|nr:biotin-dependent carboxyltransferase family protein [Bacillus sp. SG-1]EDL66145.1 Allophanate hydrolase subunit 2 [Bacillus sp. SG-1]
MGFTVEKSGLLSTIQDSGRTGYRRIGMPVSGAMDDKAFRFANLLVGNNEGDEALEVTLQGPVLHFKSDTVIAISGADLNPSINNEPVPNNKPLLVGKGDVLRFGMAEKGMRAYVAFKGGLKVVKQLGSSSTNTLAKLGGYKGRALKAGDKIALNIEGHKDKQIQWSLSPTLFTYLQKKEVRIIRSRQWDWFTEEAQMHFLSGSFTIKPESDRMGYRLSGPALALKQSQELLTEGIAKGTIQVPASGQPIILMADSQPTGGYPKIANVITADLPIIAQLKPNESLSFKEVTLEEAYEALRETEAEMKMIRAAVRMKNE